MAMAMPSERPPLRREPLALLTLVGLAACGSPNLTFGDTADDEIVPLDGSDPDATDPPSFCLNELMASNDEALLLDDGSSPDWLELYNPAEEPALLDDWVLRVNDEEVGLSGEIAAEGFVLLYADDGDSGGPTSLGLTLPAEGARVVLENPAGGGQAITYGDVQTDFSVARDEDCCTGEDCLTFAYGGTPGTTNDP